MGVLTDDEKYPPAHEARVHDQTAAAQGIHGLTTLNTKIVVNRAVGNTAACCSSGQGSIPAGPTNGMKKVSLFCYSAFTFSIAVIEFLY